MKKPLPQSFIEFIEEVQAVARTGLFYAEHEYDRERYQRLLDITIRQYTELYEIPEKELMNRYKKELGFITPKCAVNAAIINNEGKILLEQRTDDQTWGLPGGWAEVGESPQEAVIREVWEETGLKVSSVELIDVLGKLPGKSGRPNTSYHILYLCNVEDGTPAPSHESLDLGYFHINEVGSWHTDHRECAQAALEYMKEKNN